MACYPSFHELAVLVLIATISCISAFSTRATHRVTKHRNQALCMVPKYDGSKWVASSSDEEPEAGYSKIQTLLLHGPKPFFNRVFRGEEYEQAVLKFMAVDKRSRIEAQGNMDAYLRNEADWQFQRFEEARTGKVQDYWTLSPKSIVLTTAWSGVVFFFAYRAYLLVAFGEGFYSFLN